MGILIDMTGQKFGRLLVLYKSRKEADTRAYWVCRCDCGRETVPISGKYLRRGNTRSCGCLASETASRWMKTEAFSGYRVAGSITHGHKRRGHTSPEYKTWLAIKRRCSDPKHKDYGNWGARGIAVCSEWESSFEQFLSDMGQRPSLKHQIDRKDSDGNYTKENCRWVTPSVQASENRRDLREVTIEGVTFKSLAAASRHFGVSKTAISYRIKAGYSLEKAVTAATNSLRFKDNK